MRKFFVAVPIALLAIGGSTACATKKFVRTSVGEVNEKVDSQGRAIEETQERTRRNEGRIGAVGAGGQRRGGRGERERDQRGQRGQRQVRRHRQGEQAPRLRSGPERGPG